MSRQVPFWLRLTWMLALATWMGPFATSEDNPRPLLSAPLSFDGQWPIIEIEIEGQTARLVLDSGASNVALFQEQFPQLVERASAARPLKGAFGGDQTAPSKNLENVALKWGNTSMLAHTYFVSFGQMVGDFEAVPYFEGLLPPPRALSKDGIESALVFDPIEKRFAVLAPNHQLDIKGSVALPLRRADKWQWRVKMMLTPPGKQSPEELEFVVDTGMSGSLLLNGEKHPDWVRSAGAEMSTFGLGGQHALIQIEPLQLHLGEQTVQVASSATSKLPFAEDADGFIGWGLLRRFRTTFDFQSGTLYVDLDDADLKDSKPPRKSFGAGGLPNSDWSGMTVLEVHDWAVSGLQLGDTITSINSKALTPAHMYSALRNMGKSGEICWKRGEVEQQTCATVSN